MYALQVDTYGIDYGKATDSMKMSMTQATIERNTAIQNMGRLKHELEQLQRNNDQVKGVMINCPLFYCCCYLWYVDILFITVPFQQP